MRLEHSKPTRDDRERRHLTVLSGEIVFNGGATTRDCLVRNISDHGTRLVMSNTAGVPDWFTLKIKQDGRRLPARVKWRDDTSICIEFDDANELRLCHAEKPFSLTPAAIPTA